MSKLASRSGAAPHAASRRDRLEAWRENHRQVARQSVRRMLVNPLANLMTVAVLAVAMALPLGFNIVLNNLESLAGQVTDSVQMNLFLDNATSQAKGEALTARLQGRPEIANARYISREAALAEFRDQSGYQQVLDALPENPLPAVVVVTLSERSLSSDLANDLGQRLSALPEVESAQIDLLWLQRVQALIGLVQSLALGVGLALAVGVVLVIGNTVRMAIDLRKDEIAVTRLVGGTNGFIRRPFLYMGIWYGLVGAVLALLLVYFGKLALTNNMRPFLELYQSQFEFSGPGFGGILLALLGGVSLGWLGAWLASAYHLGALESR